MPHIFISYSRKDIGFAGKIVQALAEKSLDTWVDWKSIPKGEDWEQEIYRGIEEAETFLFLISPDSIKSDICNREVSHAVKNNKRIVPLLVRDSDAKNFFDEIPGKEISRRNWIFVRDGQDNFNKAIDETLNTIHTDYEWLKYHTRLQVKALEWERLNHENSFLLRGKDLQDAESQLITNASKEPKPTDLQSEYVLKSRQATDRQRVRNTSITTAGIIIMTVLTIIAIFQRGLAQQSQATAEANLIIAQTAQADTEFARQTAVANEREAIRQATISRAGELAAQSVETVEKVGKFNN